MHPQVEEILEYLASAWKDKPFAHRIEIPTNAALLNHNYAKITAKNGTVPFTWIFEVDAFDHDSYLSHHKNPLWNRVLDNINYLLYEVSERAPRALRIVLQDTITHATAGDAVRFRDFWTAHLESYGLDVGLKGYGLPTKSGHWLHFRWADSQELDAIREGRALYQDALDRLGLDGEDGAPSTNERATCAAYWKTPTVSWDGKLLPCSVDTQQRLKAGDVVHQSLTEAWWTGGRMEQMRAQALREDFTGMAICRSCSFPYSPNAARLSEPELVLIGRG